MSKIALNVIRICVPFKGAHDHDRKEERETMTTKLTADDSTIAKICRMMGFTVEAHAAMAGNPIEGKPLVFTGGGSDYSGADFPSGPAPGRGGSAPFPGKAATSPFKSRDARKLKLSDNERKMLSVTGQDPAEYCALRDGEILDPDEEQVVGVDGLLRPTRVRAPHCTMPNGQRAIG